MIVKYFPIYGWFVWFIVFNATFNNISVILWRSVLLVEEIGVPEENHFSGDRHWLQNSIHEICLWVLVVTYNNLSAIIVTIKHIGRVKPGRLYRTVH